MQTAPKNNKIDELVERADAALLSRGYFEAERMAHKALLMARQASDYERMIRVVQPLKVARDKRLALALKTKKVSVVREPVTEKMTIKPGCYLIEPPQVGADARRLRLLALQNDIPVAVICREPLTKLKQWPIVAIGAGMTVRTRIAPPKTPTRPAMKWFKGAMDALGDWAIQTIDPALNTIRRIDVILERLDCVPDCGELHDLMTEACEDAIASGGTSVPTDQPADEADIE